MEGIQRTTNRNNTLLIYYFSLNNYKYCLLLWRMRAGGVCCNSSLAYLVTVVFTNIVHINRLSAHPEITWRTMKPLINTYPVIKQWKLNENHRHLLHQTLRWSLVLLWHTHIGEHRGVFVFHIADVLRISIFLSLYYSHWICVYSTSTIKLCTSCDLHTWLICANVVRSRRIVPLDQMS